MTFRLKKIEWRELGNGWGIESKQLWPALKNPGVHPLQISSLVAWS